MTEKKLDMNEVMECMKLADSLLSGFDGDHTELETQRLTAAIQNAIEDWFETEFFR